MKPAELPAPDRPVQTIARPQCFPDQAWCLVRLLVAFLASYFRHGPVPAEVADQTAADLSGMLVQIRMMLSAPRPRKRKPWFTAPREPSCALAGIQLPNPESERDPAFPGQWPELRQALRGLVEPALGLQMETRARAMTGAERAALKRDRKERQVIPVPVEVEPATVSPWLTALGYLPSGTTDKRAIGAALAIAIRHLSRRDSE